MNPTKKSCARISEGYAVSAPIVSLRLTFVPLGAFYL